MLSLSSTDFFLKLTHLKKKSIRNAFRVSNGLDQGLDWHSVDILNWVQTVCKGYQQMTNVAVGKERVK